MTKPLGAQTRRDVLAMAAGATLAAAMPAVPALALPADVEVAIRKRFGDRRIMPGKIKLDLPPIAENGLGVPLGFEVESPMTEKDYVKTVAIFAEGNPLPTVFEGHFSPDIPRAAAQLRIRLAQTQDVVAVAELSDGQLYTVRQEVKVTIGGCGG